MLGFLVSSVCCLFASFVSLSLCLIFVWFGLVGLRPSRQELTTRTQRTAFCFEMGLFVLYCFVRLFFVMFECLLSLSLFRFVFGRSPTKAK